MSRTVSKLSQIIVQIVDEKRSLRFWALPSADLGAMYTVHLRLTEKLVVDFLLVLIELFSLGVTAEALRANIDRKLAFLKGLVSFGKLFT